MYWLLRNSWLPTTNLENLEGADLDYAQREPDTSLTPRVNNSIYFAVVMN